MVRGLLILASALALSTGCGNSKATQSVVGRRVAIEVAATGYVPHTIRAEADEDLVLVFTRTADTQCGRYITVQGTPIHEQLPMNQPVEVAVKAPVSGELVFACGMDMMHGVVIVAQE